MKKSEITMAISLFFVCILLFAVMFMQFKTVDETDITAIENLRETELREAIATWKTKYEDLEEQLKQVKDKIVEYQESIETDKEASEVLDKELDATNMLVGKTDVEGEGIVVTLTDKEDYVRATDLLELVNELRYAGAEAISINDIRVTNMTDIIELSDGSIKINGQRTVEPFDIRAIGNQTYLSSSLTLKNVGFVDKYTNSGIGVNLEKQKKVTILKANNEIKTKYLKEVISK